MWELRSEWAADTAAVEALVTATFGPGRLAKTAYRLREGVDPVPELSFVAMSTADKHLIGSVRFWPVSVGGKPSLLLGPLAVQPDLRGQGIGIRQFDDKSFGQASRDFRHGTIAIFCALTIQYDVDAVETKITICSSAVAKAFSAPTGISRTSWAMLTLPPS